MSPAWEDTANKNTLCGAGAASATLLMTGHAVAAPAPARDTLRNWGLYLVLMLAIFIWLGWCKPFKVRGLFLVSGLAVGSLYALGGIGMVVLYRATGVLNVSAGAAGAAGAMACWRAIEWGPSPARPPSARCNPSRRTQAPVMAPPSFGLSGEIVEIV